MKKNSMIKTAAFGTMFAVSTMAAALNLSSGWNLVGNNSTSAINVATTFADTSKITTVWKWNKTTGKWAFYAPTMDNTALATYAASRGYEILSTISPKEGYWINGSSGTVVTPEGTNVPTGNELSSGWNLVVGTAGNTPGQLASTLNIGLNSAGQQVSTIWAWDTASSKWKFFSPTLAAQGGTALADYISSKGYKAFDFISASDGVWVNVETSTTPPTAVVDTGPCAVPHHTVDEVLYPSSYVGAFVIPIPTQKLPTAIGRNISFKDYSPTAISFNYKNKPAGCTDAVAYGKNLYIETLNRMQAAGVESTWIYNYIYWVDIDNPTLTIATLGMQSKSGSADWSVPLSEMKFIVDEAAKRNIKVFLEIQVNKCDLQWKCLPEDPNLNIATSMSDADYNKIVAGAHSEVVQQAVIAQQAGIAGMLVDGAIYWMNGLQGARKEAYINDMISRIDDVRKVFTGKVMYKGDLSPLDSRITSKIDTLMLSIMNPQLTEEQTKNLSVPLMKDLILNQINDTYKWKLNETTGVGPNVPVMWTIFVQSKYNTFVTGFTEDGFCVSNCVQFSYKTDFSVQAIGIEAALEAIMAQTHYKNDIVHIMSGYWLTDDIEPTEWSSSACGTQSGTCDNVRSGNNFDFPNLSESIRNKPAEKLVKYWFGK